MGITARILLGNVWVVDSAPVLDESVQLDGLRVGVCPLFLEKNQLMRVVFVVEDLDISVSLVIDVLSFLIQLINVPLASDLTFGVVVVAVAGSHFRLLIIFFL